jgi:succinate dehydrogenase flavin-adding protein (antitoxin of CptAB toxin-antitoxin module)
MPVFLITPQLYQFATQQEEYEIILQQDLFRASDRRQKDPDPENENMLKEIQKYINVFSYVA